MYFYNKIVIASLLGFVLMFLSSHTQAQTDFRPGYVIKSIGDTLYGKIDYRSSIRLATICVFQSATGEEFSYKPADIFGYRFTEEKYFVSKKIKDKSYFLEFLIEGKLCVYYMEDENGSHYFLNKEDDKIIELPYEEGTKYVEDKRMNYTSTKHRGLLKYYTQDAPKLTKRVESFGKPDHQSLIKLAKKYHETVCADKACIIYEKTARLTRISIEFLGGNMTLGNNESIDTELRNKSFIQKGASVYFWTSKKNEKIFLRLGVLHTSNNVGINGYYFPLQVGYMAPRTFRIRPTIAMGLTMPTYVGGLMVRLHKKVHLGIQSWVRFIPTTIPIPIIPQEYNGIAITGNLLIDLF